jgi:hypothetical protein
MIAKEVEMTKTHLLQAVCAAAMLAAVPALAQSTMHQPTNNDSSGGNTSNSAMTPADNTGSTGGSTSSSASADTHTTHRSAMAHHTGMMRSRTDTSQDAAVDQLNQQSYASAQKGQAFNNNGSDAMAGTSSGSAPVGSGGGAAGSGGSSAK